ncbi:PDZ domain-containing protein [Arthrobacter sp. NPDC090010]|uniref:YlbL family protein n=1 Tax=Arthrobacter sp. NPDC090010 TaxID=3363942 RepID=UPI0038018D2F
MSDQFQAPSHQQPQPLPAGWGTGNAPRRRFPVGGVLIALFFVAVAVAALLPLPYVVESPGPTYNTIGSVNDKQVIAVTGRQSYPTSGQLDLTTVYVSGGPNGRVTAFDLLQAFLDPSKAVYNEDQIFPKGITKQQSDQENALEMTSSQENATAAALTALKIPFKQSLEVADAAKGSPAEGKLKAGDVLLEINGKASESLTAVRSAVDAAQGNEMTVTVLRGGARQSVKVTAVKGENGQYLMGIGLQFRYTFPFKVQYQLDQVGGPSAGMMFTLGLIDTLTPGDLTGGKHVAGTGTISPDGQVGPIGGIAQKMHGARAAGAGLFLAPAANCSDVVGHIPDGLTVLKVATLSDARTAVETYAKGGDLSSLPHCTAG